MNDTALPALSDRRNAILARMAAACSASGRPLDAITLTAVSKRQPDDLVDAALATGQRVFGENRVQEAAARWTPARREMTGLQLRLIGPLQSNKAMDAVAQFDVIETLDREKLARALADAIQAQGRAPELLVQINTGEEAQKSGIVPAQMHAFLARLHTEYALNPTGLMCIPPVNEPAGPHFALLARLAREAGLDVLSMGMSGDFETAITFGATHVRVGSALFGEREA